MLLARQQQWMLFPTFLSLRMNFVMVHDHELPPLPSSRSCCGGKELNNVEQSFLVFPLLIIRKLNSLPRLGSHLAFSGKRAAAAALLYGYGAVNKLGLFFSILFNFSVVRQALFYLPSSYLFPSYW